MTQAELPAGHPDISDAAAKPQLTWKVPAGWTELPPGEIRVASFKVAGNDGQQADVSVTPLPGVAGDDLSNVNRWRGQVGQPPVTEEELKAAVQAVAVAGQPAALYDQAGETMRILAAIQRRENTAWFFKMTGDTDLVDGQKPVFIEFLQSVQFGGDTAVSGPKWDVPADWTEAPAGQFLFAKFTMAGGQAAVNVSTSPGDGGGLAANVNRWRKQLGLGELTGDELAKSVATSDGVTVVEMAGEHASLVAAVVTQPGKVWFYKLMGDAPVVAAQKDAFMKFVREVKY